MATQNNKYLDVFPEKMVLTRQLEQNFYESKATLYNTSTQFVIYKMYINRDTVYSVNPSTSFIAPGDKAEITIKRLDKVLSTSFLTDRT